MRKFNVVKHFVFSELEIAQKFSVNTVGIDHRDDGSQVNVRVGIFIFVGEETCADGAGVTDAGGFNKYDFDRIKIGNLLDLLNEFIAQSAANATVLQFKHWTFGDI